MSDSSLKERTIRDLKNRFLESRRILITVFAPVLLLITNGSLLVMINLKP
jgi:hypothetical protein